MNSRRAFVLGFIIGLTIVLLKTLVRPIAPVQQKLTPEQVIQAIISDPDVRKVLVAKIAEARRQFEASQKQTETNAPQYKSY